MNAIRCATDGKHPICLLPPQRDVQLMQDARVLDTCRTGAIRAAESLGKSDRSLGSAQPKTRVTVNSHLHLTCLPNLPQRLANAKIQSGSIYIHLSMERLHNLTEGWPSGGTFRCNIRLYKD